MILIFIFFTATPLIILTSLFSLYQISDYQAKHQSIQLLTIEPPRNVKVFAPAVNNVFSITQNFITGDAREELVKNYLKRYNSPLGNFSSEIIQVSDKYNIDYRLLTAIAQQESNLCKVIPQESFNCWGWGIHSKGTLGFSSFPEAIETVGKGIKEEYLDKGYRTPLEIMSKYTPNSNGSWAFGVSYFMDEIENGLF